MNYKLKYITLASHYAIYGAYIGPYPLDCVLSVVGYRRKVRDGEENSNPKLQIGNEIVCFIELPPDWRQIDCCLHRSKVAWHLQMGHLARLQGLFDHRRKFIARHGTKGHPWQLAHLENLGLPHKGIIRHLKR